MLLRFFIITVLISLLLPAFTQTPISDTNELKQLVLGKVVTIRSTQLNEKRILNIYLPADYLRNDTPKYPVVYLLDGGIDEDFIHIVGLYQFNSFPWVDRVHESIVVGIVNIDRQRDFTFPLKDSLNKAKYPTAGHSENFIDFIEKDLQPYIGKTYRVNDSKTIIGESLGGLLATQILFERPGLFNRYIIVSPSLWWDNGAILNKQTELGNQAGKKKISVYIGVGKEGLSPGKNPHVGEVDANVLAEKLGDLKIKNMDVYFDYLPQENHATIEHQAVLNALRYFSNNK